MLIPSRMRQYRMRRPIMESYDCVVPLGSSMAAVKASAVSWPTPGMLINRWQASDTLTIRLMSASIALTAARAAIRPRMAADSPRYPGWPAVLAE
jgi:hypothetical protein